MYNKKIKLFIIFVLCLTFIQRINALEKKDAYIEDITVYGQKNVEISWGELNFTYDINSSYDWNSSTHKYDNNTKSTWISKGNEIQIENKSYIPIDVDFKYKSINSNNINISFSKNHIHLEKKQKDSTKVYPSGQPKNKTNIFNKIGVVTAVVT
ncbi:MAG: hypothetical protein IKF91_03345 [Bacilli bacterium]|nr:hypothetical protein [Bacilli bacterium]